MVHIETQKVKVVRANQKNAKPCSVAGRVLGFRGFRACETLDPQCLNPQPETLKKGCNLELNTKP